MGTSKNEIIEAFARELKAADEYRKPMEMTEEQYRELEKGNVAVSGEGEWTPQAPEPLQPQWVERWKTHIKPGDTESGKGEWHNPDVDYDPEEEMTKRDVPDSDDFDPGYRYNPDEKTFRGPWHPERRPEHLKKKDEEKRKSLEGPKEEPKPEEKYSDEEYFKMVKEEPEHVATNLMLQREAPYNQFKYVYPLVKALTQWVTDLGYSPERGSILYEELAYMLDIAEQEAERREREEAEKTPSGETEWKPE